jgi:undecaprenyl-diphosphatase
LLFAVWFLLLFLLLWLFFALTLPALEKALAKTAHFTSKFRYRDYLPVAIVLAAGVVVTMAAGDAFVDIAERVHEGSPKLHRVDAEVHSWARTTYTDGSTRFFTILTLIGTPVGMGIVVAIVAAVLASRGRWRWAALLIFTTGVGGLLNLQLKAYFARARPDLAEALRNAHGYSFPSGHAMGSTIVFGALAYLAFRAFRNWKLRAAAVALSVTMIVAIATSRIYLGVHWVSDIGAGVAAGLIWVGAATVAYETFRRIRMIRSLRARAADQAEASSLRTSRGE